MNMNDFIGLSELDARTLAAKAGLVVSINTAVPTMLTNSIQPNRITLTVHEGRVTGATMG